MLFKWMLSFCVFTQASNFYQGIFVTDGIQTFAVAVHFCEGIGWGHEGLIGYSTPDGDFHGDEFAIPDAFACNDFGYGSTYTQIGDLDGKSMMYSISCNLSDQCLRSPSGVHTIGALWIRQHT